MLAPKDGRPRKFRSTLGRKSASLPRRTRKNKFGVAPAVFRVYNGDLYDSRLEADYARYLDLLRNVVTPDYRVVDIQRQVQVKLEVNGQLICRYLCDFLVKFADGRCEWHEVKGFETDTWKIKEKLFRALFPDRRLVVIRRVPA